jgi:hypothetical protein
MFVTQVALVSETGEVDCRQLSKVAAALQKQALRDFQPLWGINATVDAFDVLDDVPLGYWPILIRDDIEMEGAAGVHLDNNGQPLALVQFDEGWALTASHELLEMLADPWGNRLMAGESPKEGQGRVEFLVEVADPSEAPDFGYRVNGILVSDFLTTNFWDPDTVPGVRYSFMNRIPGPRQIVRGGYISWHVPVTDEWWQQIWFTGTEPEFRNLGVLSGRVASLRAAIDARAHSARRLRSMTKQAPALRTALAARPQIAESSSARMNGVRSRIDELKAGAAEGEWQGGDQIEDVQ